jgi:hypothetical protein
VQKEPKQDWSWFYLQKHGDWMAATYRVLVRLLIGCKLGGVFSLNQIHPHPIQFLDTLVDVLAARILVCEPEPLSPARIIIRHSDYGTCQCHNI